MIHFFCIEEAGAKGLPPLSPAPPIPAELASASLQTISLDDSEHLLHNHRASVASLRLLFTFAPERRSASLRNRCSPSTEYSDKRASRKLAGLVAISRFCSGQRPVCPSLGSDPESRRSSVVKGTGLCGWINTQVSGCLQGLSVGITVTSRTLLWLASGWESPGRHLSRA